VTHDLLGLFDRFTPSFVKKYSDLYSEMSKAFESYISDVKDRRFPAAEHGHSMDPQELRTLIKGIELPELEFDADDNSGARFN
jgi:3-methyl-2-oxobutanoate hydroxymethyltransferase